MFFLSLLAVVVFLNLGNATQANHQKLASTTDRNRRQASWEREAPWAVAAGASSRLCGSFAGDTSQAWTQARRWGLPWRWRGGGNETRWNRSRRVSGRVKTSNTISEAIRVDTRVASCASLLFWFFSCFVARAYFYIFFVVPTDEYALNGRWRWQATRWLNRVE